MKNYLTQLIKILLKLPKVCIRESIQHQYIKKKVFLGAQLKLEVYFRD